MKNFLLELISEATKQNPITRRELVNLTHIKDRQVRDLIGELRGEGNRIVSTSKGYYIAENEDDYKAFRAVYIAKARCIFDRVSAMDAYTGGQESMRV